MTGTVQSQHEALAHNAARLARVNRTLRMLTAANQALIHASDENALLEEICRVVVELGGFPLAWIGYAEQDAGKSIRPVAQRGYGERDLRDLGLTWADDERGRAPTGTAIRSGEYCYIADVRSDPHRGPWRDAAAKRGYASAIALPLRSGGRVEGALTIFTAIQDAFDAEEIALLLEMAGDLAFGIRTLRLGLRHEATLAELRALNAGLEQRIAERTGELEAKTRELEDLYEYAPCGYHSLDRSGVFVRINDTELRWLGYARDEVVGKLRFTDVLTPESAKAFEEFSPVFTQRGRISDAEFEMLRKDGSILPVSLSASAIRDAGGDYLMSRSTLFDITQRKRSDEELRRSRAFLDSIVEHIPDTIVVKDARALRFVRLNRAGEELFGYSRAEMIGRSDYDFSPKEQAEFIAATDRQVLESGALVEIPEQLVKTRYRGFRLMAAKKMPILDQHGKPEYLLTIAEDITERRRDEAALRRQAEEIERKNAELERANSMKSQFLASMSHELRTPLNAIIGFSEVLKDGLLGDLSAKQSEFVLDIHNSGKHLLSLVNDILDLSKIDAGVVTLELEAVDLAGLFHNSLSVVREKATAQRLRLDVVVEAGLPAVHADARKMKQIIYNLLSNAVKFTPAGGSVTLGARRVARAEVALPADVPGRMGTLPPGDDQDLVEIAVRDTGIGIADADLGGLFQAFVQIDGTLSRKFHGTGLGLAMVKNLAGLHGGTVGVSSVRGKGSTFLIWLPLASAGPLPASPAGPLALVIEDDDDAARMIESRLKEEGFRTMRAATGEEGLVRSAKERPQLISLDILLPNMDGWTVIERLKANPDLAGIPIIVVTAKVLTAQDRVALAGEALRVMHKASFDGDSFIEEVRSAMRSRAANGEGGA